MSLPPLNALRAFEAVVRHGSFKAASEALFVTQSAVSHQVRNLETWLGGPLFSRDGNRTTLLPHGLELANILSRALADIDAACESVRVGAAAQPLVIAAIPSVAMCWLIPRLSQFRADHPEIEIRIVYAHHGTEINFSDVHIAFSFLPEPPAAPMVEAQLFLRGDSLPVCSPALLSRPYTPKTPDELKRLGLLHDTDTSGWKRWFAHMGHEISGPLSGATFEDFNLLRAAALSGQGVALCPRAMIEPDLSSGALVVLAQDTLVYGSDYYMITSRRASPGMEKQIRRFADWALLQK